MKKFTFALSALAFVGALNVAQAETATTAAPSQGNKAEAMSKSDTTQSNQTAQGATAKQVASRKHHGKNHKK